MTSGPFPDLLAEHVRDEVAAGFAAERAHTLAHQAGEGAHPLLRDLLGVALDHLGDGLTHRGKVEVYPAEKSGAIDAVASEFGWS